MSETRYLVNSSIYAWLACTLYVLAMALAAAADRRTLYTTQLPGWLDPTTPFSLSRYLGYLVRTRSSVLRILCVVPDHTPFTRVQLVHLLYTNVATTAVIVMVTFGVEQCTEAAAALAFLCALLAKLVVSLGRRIFRKANASGRKGAALAYHELQRKLAHLASAEHARRRPREEGRQRLTWSAG